jgi:hypothetical protein
MEKMTGSSPVMMRGRNKYSGFRFSNQIPQTEFSKGRQLDGKVIGINTDGSACNMDFEAFRKRQRGTKISVD